MKTIPPYKRIGIMGGGQLGRMMCQAAKAMGYYVAVVEPTPNCPCGQVADLEITAPYDSLEAAKQLAEYADVITYEFENVNYKALTWLEENAYLPSGSEVLRIAQHRYLEKTAISEMGIKTADFSLGLQPPYTFPSILKTTTGGYDGKGQIVLKSEADLPAALELANAHECILEKFVPYTMEISVIACRSSTGEVKSFPVAENIHKNNILHQTIVPARISQETAQQATEIAEKIVTNLKWVGVMGIEMFVLEDGNIVVNEIAPRPHNSGHYTLDACVTSQFEQHIRCICGLPLGDTALHTHVVMVNILGDHLNMRDLSDLAPYFPLLKNGKIHLYGKPEARKGRKMGHLNMLGDTDESLKALAQTQIWEESK